MKNRLIMAISALTLIALATAAFAAPVSLTIERPKMREIYISWLSQDGASADCVITQRLTIFSPWEPMKTFSLASGATFAINMDNTMPIYSEQKVSCTSGDVSILTSSTFKIFGGQSIVQSCPVLSCPVVEPVVCPACHTVNQYCQDGTDCCVDLYCKDSTHKCTVTTTTTTTLPPPTTTTTLPQCYDNGVCCSLSNECCSGYCGGDWKCHNPPTTTTTTIPSCKDNGANCSNGSECCSLYCHENQGEGHKHCHVPNPH